MFILTASLTTIQHWMLYCQHVKKEDLSFMTSAMIMAAIFLQQGTGVFFNSCICSVVRGDSYILTMVSPYMHNI